jgi:hypothetical protein
MAILSVKEKRVSGTEASKQTEPEEIMAFCPGCKALQTIWLNRNVLMPTQKFRQSGSRIYHNCGCQQPCRLYYAE